MEVYGYSERGMLNSLICGIKCSGRELDMVDDLLSKIYFPANRVDFHVKEVKVLLDQSFSDFGRSDAILLIENNGTKMVVFLEAKIGSSQRSWRISKEFNKFESGLERSNVSSSNMFVQLHHKARMIYDLQFRGKEHVKSGARLSRLHSKVKRKIGKNKVIQKAVDMIEDYCDETLFISLVPDTMDELEHFYETVFKNYSTSEFPFGEIGVWGFLSWEQVFEFAEENDLESLLENFSFNEDLIY